MSEADIDKLRADKALIVPGPPGAGPEAAAKTESEKVA